MKQPIPNGVENALGTLSATQEPRAPGKSKNKRPTKAQPGSLDEPLRSKWAETLSKEWRERLRQFKKSKRLTDSEISASIGVVRATVNSWMNAREPGVREFLHLCEAMGADPRYILFGEAPPAQEPPPQMTPREFLRRYQTDEQLQGLSEALAEIIDRREAFYKKADELAPSTLKPVPMVKEA